MRSETRQKIIDTASELFYRKGYNLTGINEIIEESGIAKATLYSHFKSKEELLLAYLDAKDAGLLESISAFCESRPIGDDRLLAVLEFLVSFFNEEGFNGCWCIRTIAEVPMEHTVIRNRIRKNKDTFRTFLKTLVANNKPDLNTTQQEALANRLYLLYEGALTESHLQNEQWPIDTAIGLLKDILKTA